MLAVYDVGDLNEIKKYNSIEVDAEGRITFFEEKPAEPKSTLTGIALYYYPKSSLPLIRQYIAEGNNPDQPGRLCAMDVSTHAFLYRKVPGLWFDVGSKETLEEANRVFAQSVQRNAVASGPRCFDASSITEHTRRYRVSVLTSGPLDQEHI